MILVLGGTTEGRKVAETLDRAGKPFFYSTKSDFQKIESLNALRISGPLTRDGMTDFCLKNEIRLIVDAAHPFASLLHETVSEVADALSIPVIRYERIYPERDPSLIWCDGYEDAMTKLEEYGVDRLLSLTGVQTIAKLKRYWSSHECYFRILDREESLAKARRCGFPENKLLFYDPGTPLSALMERIRPEAILTKESGESGGFNEKVKEASLFSLNVFVISRPPLPKGFKVVTGEYGLRKAVESLLPGFFELRSGFTTGACATAAAKAAIIALKLNEYPEYVSFRIPDGEEMMLPVSECILSDGYSAEATVIKDAGDDPDVTDGCRIKVRVTLTDSKEIRFFGGEGIGTVTLPGLGLAIGEPAINPVPRNMIRNEILKIHPDGCDVTISAEGGRELARHTFNPRIGIVGGISIIGTSGVVMPFSNEAFIEAIHREMNVAKASGCSRVVLNSGARSEKAVRKVYPELPDSAFVHYGNAIGESLKIAAEIGIDNLTLGVMIGKAVKLAEGNLDTHSHKVTMNRDFLASVAREAGCHDSASDVIMHLNMARELWESLSPDDGDKFFPMLLSRCKKVCMEYFPGALTLMLITDNGDIRYTI